MLPEEEQTAARKLLRMLVDNDLFKLAKSTVKRVVTGSREDAIGAILTHSESSEELLNRMILRKEVLFEYLDNRDISVKNTGTKSHFISKILEYWRKPSNPAAASVSRPQKPFAASVSQSQRPVAASVSRPQKRFAASVSRSQRPVSVSHSHRPSASSRSQNPFATFTPVHQNESNASAHHTELTWVEEGVPEGNYGRQELENNAEAVQFATLFYTMLNACRSTEASAVGGEFQARHFYDDCSLHLFYLTNKQRVEEEFKGGQVVFERLRAFVSAGQLQFKANTNVDGTIGQSDPSGLTVIRVCGTVHKGNQPVGIFEQKFSLVRDPSMENNWRIKFTNLKLLSKVPQQRLTLHETELIMAVAAMKFSF